MESLLHYWPVLLASMLAGFVDSIGGGGGLLTVPALLNAGIPPAFLLGTNKGMATLGSTAALFRYARAGLLPRLLKREWGVLFGSVVCLAALGAFLSTHPLVVDNLRIFIPLVQIFVLTFLVRRWFFQKVEIPVDNNPQALKRFSTRVGIGIIGTYDGLFGPGTGTFFLSLLERAGFSTLHANALTKVLNFASNLGALMLFAAFGKVMWPLSLAGAGAYLIGNYCGAGVVLKKGQTAVRFVVIFTTVALLLRSLYYYFAVEFV